MDTVPIDYNSNNPAKPHHIHKMLSKNNSAGKLAPCWYLKIKCVPVTPAGSHHPLRPVLMGPCQPYLCTVPSISTRALPGPGPGGTQGPAKPPPSHSCPRSALHVTEAHNLVHSCLQGWPLGVFFVLNL